MTDTSSASKYGFALAVALLAAPGSARAAPALSCPDMATQTVPASAIGLPTTGATVTAAINVTAGGNAPQTYGEYCQAISASIRSTLQRPSFWVQLDLPAVWNSRR